MKNYSGESMGQWPEVVNKFLNDKTRESIGKNIDMHDKPDKALTGRTPEIIQEETGFKKEDIFPENKQILYVGDPWQRMGKEINDSRLKIIDYEFGETASFVENEKYFRQDVIFNGENLLEGIEAVKGSVEKEEDKKWLEDLHNLISEALDLSKSQEIDFYENFYNNEEYGGEKREENKNKLDKNYEKAAEAWGKAKRLITEKYSQDKTLKDETEIEQREEFLKKYYNEEDDFEKLRQNAWYKCIEGERGFKDISDLYNIIIPKLEKKIEEIGKKESRVLSEEETDDLVEKYKKKFIDEIRLRKKTDKAEVLQARFPELPFKDKSFDRFVASWSISAHIFNALNKEEFNMCWKEIARVLAKNGEAYIFPLNYYFDDRSDLVESLKEASVKENFSWGIYDFSDKTKVEAKETKAMDEDYIKMPGSPAYTLKIKMNQ